MCVSIPPLVILASTMIRQRGKGILSIYFHSDKVFLIHQLSTSDVQSLLHIHVLLSFSNIYPGYLYFYRSSRKMTILAYNVSHKCVTANHVLLPFNDFLFYSSIQIEYATPLLFTPIHLSTATFC